MHLNVKQNRFSVTWLLFTPILVPGTMSKHTFTMSYDCVPKTVQPFVYQSTVTM